MTLEELIIENPELSIDNILILFKKIDISTFADNLEVGKCYKYIDGSSTTLLIKVISKHEDFYYVDKVSFYNKVIDVNLDSPQKLKFNEYCKKYFSEYQIQNFDKIINIFKELMDFEIPEGNLPNEEIPELKRYKTLEEFASNLYDKSVKSSEVLKTYKEKFNNVKEHNENVINLLKEHYPVNSIIYHNGRIGKIIGYADTYISIDFIYINQTFNDVSIFSENMQLNGIIGNATILECDFDVLIWKYNEIVNLINFK
jgi:hypothetical protein